MTLSFVVVVVVMNLIIQFANGHVNPAIRITGAAERPRQFLSTRLRIGVGIDAMKPRFESADRPWAVDCAVQVAPAALQSEASGECHRTIRWSSRRCLLEVVLRYGSNPHIPASHERSSGSEQGLELAEMRCSSLMGVKPNCVLPTAGAHLLRASFGSQTQ